MRKKAPVVCRPLSPQKLIFFSACLLSVFLMCGVIRRIRHSYGTELLVYREIPLIPANLLAKYQLAPSSKVDACRPRTGTRTRNLRGCSECPEGKFMLPGWFVCRAFLSCDDIHNNVRVTGSLLHYDNHDHYSAHWEDFKFRFVCPDAAYRGKGSENFVLKLGIFQKHLPIVGYCNKDRCTAAHSGDNDLWRPLSDVLGNPLVEGTNHWYVRFVILYNLLDILSRIHGESELGVFAMCNTDSVEGILHKFLVNDNGIVQVGHVSEFVLVHGSLVGEGIDECPKRNSSSHDSRWSIADPPEMAKFCSTCVRYSLDESAVVPRTTYYDVWAVPDVTQYFLQTVTGGTRLLNYLEGVHQKCKNANPHMRPSMDEVRTAYMDVLWNFIPTT